LHELEVHRLELEMQNEALQAARLAAETDARRYAELYDCAPAGYFTLDRSGAITQINLAGARLLGLARTGLAGRRFGLFVAEESRPSFTAFLTTVFSSPAKAAGEFCLLREGQPPFPAQLEATAFEAGPECRVVMVDLTVRKAAEAALEQARADLQRAQAISHVGDWEYRVADGRLQWSDELYRIFGLAPQSVDLTYDRLEAMIHPGDRAALASQLERLLAMRTAGEFEPFGYRVQRPDGRLAHVLVEVRMQFDSRGQPDRLFGTVQDVTARHKGDQEQLRLTHSLDRQVAWNHTLLQTMLDGYLLTDLEGKILEVNPGYCRIVGCESEELIAHHFREREPAGLAGDAAEQTAQLLRVGRVRFETRHRHQAGGEVNLEVSLTLVGQPPDARVAAFLRDITRQKQAEERLLEAHLELLAVNRIVSAITGVLQPREILARVLHEALELVGLEGGAIYLTTPQDTLVLATQQAMSGPLVRELTTHPVKLGEGCGGTCARTRHPIILREPMELLPGATGEAAEGGTVQFRADFPLLTGDRCVGVLCLFTRTANRPRASRLKLLKTVTAQVALAILNSQLHEEIRGRAADLECRILARTAELQIARDRAEAADRVKSAFLATMSHELRTPLHSIVGFTGLLLQGLAGPLNAEQTKQLSIVDGSGQRLLALINDVLDLAKFRAGQHEFRPAPFDLREAMQQVVHIMTPLVDARQVALVVRCTPEASPLTSDRRRVEQVLLNLLGNAIKFTERGQVTLTAEVVATASLPVVAGGLPSPGQAAAGQPAAGRVVQISVTDTGIGIQSGDLGAIFEPFYQLDGGPARPHRGTGLGLSICKQLVEALGGAIWVTSVWGQGSTFSFTLPLETATPAGNPPQNAPRLPPLHPPPAPKHPPQKRPARGAATQPPAPL